MFSLINISLDNVMAASCVRQDMVDYWSRLCIQNGKHVASFAVKLLMGGCL